MLFTGSDFSLREMEIHKSKREVQVSTGNLEVLRQGLMLKFP